MFFSLFEKRYLKTKEQTPASVYYWSEFSSIVPDPVVGSMENIIWSWFQPASVYFQAKLEKYQDVITLSKIARWLVPYKLWQINVDFEELKNLPWLNDQERTLLSDVNPAFVKVLCGSHN